MRARDVVLALLVIAAGVFLTYAKSGRLDDWFIGWEGPWFGTFEEFVYEETRDLPGPMPAEVQILNAHGTVEVSGTSEDKGAVIVFKERINARNRAEADKIAEALRMVVTQTEDRLVLATNREEFRRRNFSTDFKIVVPAGTAVYLKNSYGRVRVENAGKTEISNPHGDVLVSGSQGPLSVTSSYKAVNVDGVRGDAHISASHAEVDVRNVEGSVGLDHSYGRIGLDRVGLRTVVNGNHSRVTALNLGGEAEIATSYEKIVIAGAKSVRIRAHHSDVEARDIDGWFDLANTYGSVRVSGLSGDLRIDGRNLGVTGLGLGAGTIYVRTTYQDVSLSGFTGPAELVLSHSRLTLEPAAELAGTVDVRGEYADVNLAWPAGYRAPFEAQTRNGRIAWNLAEKPDSEISNGKTELRAFSSETGKPGIKIVTAHADVRIDAAGR